MPYVNPWDEAAPSGLSNANTLDTIIQAVKAAVGERLDDIIPGFRSDAVDPKILGPGQGRWLVDTIANRPGAGAFIGQGFYATDENKGYIADGALAWQEVTTEIPAPPRAFIIDAGAEEYNPGGATTRATRVKNAIAAAVATAGLVNVVYVPENLWGYVSDGDFNASMYNHSILLVREGALAPWYDPVAYGADVNGAVSSQAAIDAAVTGATTGTSPGIKVVAFTMPGQYLKNANINQGAEILALVQFPGVTHTGAGTFTGEWAWVIDGVYNVDSGVIADRPAAGRRIGHAYIATDTGKYFIWDGAAWVEINPTGVVQEAYTYNGDAAVGARAAEVTVVKELYLKYQGTIATGHLLPHIDFTEAQFGGKYDVANIISITSNFQFYTTKAATGSSFFNIEASVDPTANRLNLSARQIVDSLNDVGLIVVIGLHITFSA